MYLWIGLGISDNDSVYIRDYCRNINKDYNVNEQSFSLPQHISLKTSFYTENYISIINGLKNMIDKKEILKLRINNVGTIPGVIWLEIDETNYLREFHNMILDYLKNEYNIDKSGFDGDTFKFHSTLFQDIESKKIVDDLYEVINKQYFSGKEIIVDKIYFGISEIGKVGTYKVIDYIDLRGEYENIR